MLSPAKFSSPHSPDRWSYIITPSRPILGNLKKLLPVELCVTPVALVKSLGAMRVFLNQVLRPNGSHPIHSTSGPSS
jgi:hypothetical protein